MPPYIYPFEQFHPEAHEKCLQHRHSVTFWHGTRIVGDAQFFEGQPGNVALNLPSDLVQELKDGKLSFTLRESFADKNDPTLILRCLLSRTIAPQ